MLPCLCGMFCFVSIFERAFAFCKAIYAIFKVCGKSVDIKVDRDT